MVVSFLPLPLQLPANHYSLIGDDFYYCSGSAGTVFNGSYSVFFSLLIRVVIFAVQQKPFRYLMMI